MDFVEFIFICWKSLIKTQSMKLPRIILIIKCSDPWEPGCVRLAIIALLPSASVWLPSLSLSLLYCPQLRFAQFLQRPEPRAELLVEWRGLSGDRDPELRPSHRQGRETWSRPLIGPEPLIWLLIGREPVLGHNWGASQAWCRHISSAQPPSQTKFAKGSLTGETFNFVAKITIFQLLRIQLLKLISQIIDIYWENI